jgi:hypothetical protein
MFPAPANTWDSAGVSVDAVGAEMLSDPLCCWCGVVVVVVLDVVVVVDVVVLAVVVVVASVVVVVLAVVVVVASVVVVVVAAVVVVVVAAVVVVVVIGTVTVVVVTGGSCADAPIAGIKMIPATSSGGMNRRRTVTSIGGGWMEWRSLG